MSENQEVTLFDIADWLWSFRFLALALLIVAALWVGIAAYAVPHAVSSQQYEVHVRIFPSGSPLRSPTDISSIVTANLTKAEATELTSEPEENPLIFRASGAQRAEAALMEIADLSAQLTEEVGDRVALLEPIIATNESAVTPYLVAKDFISATNNGIFELISAKSVPVSNDVGAPSIMRAVMFPVIVCGIAFFILALAVSFVRAWRQRKINRANQ